MRTQHLVLRYLHNIHLIQQKISLIIKEGEIVQSGFVKIINAISLYAICLINKTMLFV